MTQPDPLLDKMVEPLSETQRAFGTALVDALLDVNPKAPQVFAMIVGSEPDGVKVTFSPREVGLRVGLTGGLVMNLVNDLAQASVAIELENGVSMSKAILHLDECGTMENGQTVLTVIHPKFCMDDLFTGEMDE